MTVTRALVLTAAGVAVGWAAGAWPRAKPVAGGNAASYHTGLTVERVQALSSLVTARVDVADVQETRVDGHTGGARAALLVKGDFLVGTDLSRARFESVDQSARTAVLVLPQPQVNSPRIDHERTRVFAVTETGLWQVTPGDGQTSAAVIQRGYRDAQRYIAGAAGDPSLLARSRQQAEHVLGTFFAATGWRITVRWEG